MKRADEQQPTVQDLMNYSIRAIATWLVLAQGMTIDDAILRAGEVFSDVGRRHCFLLANLPAAVDPEVLFPPEGTA